MENMDNILERIQKIKEEMINLQQDLKEMYVYGEEEKNLVKALINGKGKVLDYEFKTENVDNEIKKAIIKATNDGLQKATQLEQKKKQEIIGDVDIPDIPGLF